MRVLIDTLTGQAGAVDLDDDAVRALYEPPAQDWWRVNMVATLDGAATGASQVSDSVNTVADKRGFDALRGWAQAIVVGAGTARSEGYGPAAVPLVVVSRSASVPETLREAEPGQVLMATTAAAEHLAAAREMLGESRVWVSPGERVDLVALRGWLAGRGLRQVLSEGGPSLLGDLLAAGVLDEVCLSIAPRLLCGDFRRIATGSEVDVATDLGMLAEEDGTLLARWLVRNARMAE